MNKRACRAMAGLGLAMVCGWSPAEENVFGQTLGQPELLDEQLTSVAAGHSQPIQAAPAVVSVITASQISRMGARDLYDVLRTVPGFFAGKNVGNSIEPTLSVRGFKSSFNQNVLVLLDGIPQTEHTTGDRFAVLGKIPLDAIERVEIMRGPGSALHGADAYSAVIDVITRTAPPDQTQITLAGGSNRTRDARVIGGGQQGDFKWVGAIEYHRTDGDRPYIPADFQTVLDALLGTDASLAPGHANTRAELFGALLNVTGDRSAFMLRTSLARDIGASVGAGGALDPFGRLDLSTLEGRYSWTARGDDWSAKAVFAQTFFQTDSRDNHLFPPGAFPFFPDGVLSAAQMRQSRTRFQGSWDYAGVASHRFTAGVGAEFAKTDLRSEQRNFAVIGGRLRPLGTLQEIADADLLMFGAREFSHDLRYLYLQDEWRFADNWTLTWGLRHDHYADYGDQMNPRAALVWETSPYLSVKLFYGQGFRGPSLLDTHGRQVPGFIGTPDLKPERINSLEFAVDYQVRDGLLLRLNAFDQKTSDQIQIFTDRTPAIPLNTARQRGRGAELEAWWDITPHTQLYAAYSYQDSTDATTDSDVGYHPHHLFYSYLQHRQKPWSFFLQARHVGPRDRRIIESRPKAETYTHVDGLVRYEFSPGLEFGLEVRNLLDAEANDNVPGASERFPSDIPLPGRTYYFTLSGRF